MAIRKLTLRHQVEAKTVRPFLGNSGIYVSVQPTADTQRILCEWAGELSTLQSDAQVQAPDEFHCTLMYSKVVPVNIKIWDPAMDYLAHLDYFEYWDGHDGDGYLVAVMKSPSLVHRHKKWCAQGAVHSFPDYTPHVTLLEKFRPNKELPAQLARMSSEYAGTPLSFTREQIENCK